MEAALRAALPSSAEVVQSTAQAEVVLTALDDRTYRIVAASTTAGQVREFRLRAQLKFRLSRPDGRVLLGDTELQRERDLSYTETAALSKQVEEEALLQEMRDDLAQQVLRMLVVAARKPLPPLPAAASASALRAMQVRSDQLPQQLARGLKPLYVIHGDEPLLAQEAGDAVRAAARAAGYSEREVFTVSGAHFDWSGVLGAAQSMGLFGDQKLIEIRIPSGKPGKDGSAALQQYCDLLPEGVLTLVHLPRLDRQQLQGAWFQALERVGVSVRVDPIERAQLPAWIAQRLAAQGQRLPAGEAGQQALAFFADRVEGNLLAAHQELQKLALLYPAGELGFEQIEEAVLDVARFDVFKLGTAVLAGQAGRPCACSTA
jgi:DNA polymerase III delta subunit